MPKASKRSTKKASQKVSPGILVSSVPAKGGDRLAHWLCMPNHTCVPVTPEETRSFTESANWKIFRIMAEFIEGFEFLSKLKNEVTIFGSARAMPGTPHYEAARKLGALLGKKGYSVITGGGPGIMEAANRGATEAGGVSVGLNIELATEQRINPYVNKAMGFHYFFTRKVMLSASAQAYVFFPGGFGTIDEMSEMLTLIQTAKIPRHVPFILFGSAFWKPFMAWAKQAICEEHRYIEPEELDIIQIVDTPEEVMKLIAKTSERNFG
jgi:uncharacterized protein (TIGR00730 family)